MKTYLANLSADLIRFKSIDYSEYSHELKNILDWVEKKLKKSQGVYLKRFLIKNKPALIATFKPNHKQPKLFLNGHLDVVPAEEYQFVPKIVGNKLFGRGAHDMKGACACMIALIEHFAKQKEKPDVGFMFVTDEEFHGDESHAFFQKGYRSSLLMTLEPTNLDLVVETKGMLWLEGIIPGKAAHGSKPWLGENPLEDFHKGLKKFYKLFPPLRREKWATTYNIGEVKSGDCFNRVPPDLFFKIDFRYVALDSPQVILKKVKNCFPKNTKWRIERCDPPHTKAKDMVLIQKLKKITEELGLPTKYTRAPFCTDARFFAAGGLNCAVFGAIGDGMHSNNEWVDIESLGNLFEALRIFCSRL